MSGDNQEPHDGVSECPGYNDCGTIEATFPMSILAPGTGGRPRAASYWQGCGDGRVRDNFIEFTGGGESSASVEVTTAPEF